MIRTLRTSWVRTGALISIGLVVGAPSIAQAPGPKPAEEGLPRYKQCIVRKPFRFQTTGRMSLARRGDADALKILLKDFRRPPAYEDHARYTLASMFVRILNDIVSVEMLEKFKHEFTKPGDAWLWLKVMQIEVRQRGPAEVLKVAEKSPSLFLRAAAIEALARAGDASALDAVPAACAALPKKDGERRLIVGALSSAILTASSRMHNLDTKKAVTAYINLLHKDVKLAHSAKMVIARHLSKLFGKPTLYVEPEPWLRILASGQEPPKRSGNTVTALRFFGIEAEGDRICYVIDMSNSMCKPVDPALTKRGPITGPKKKRKRKRGQAPDENDIPWHKIKSRFDLAREHLKISIQRLSKDKRFCVVWFGTKSGMLNSCKGMIKASKGNVKKVIRELDSIVTMPAKLPDAPDGVLRGTTNLHSGLRKAFALRAKGFADRHEYVDIKAMAEGCDTIFLLSDGAPKWDDFSIKDRDYGEGKVIRDAEYGKAATRTPEMVYWGPYDKSPWLDDDIDRMNVFRKVQIHCIGIGEADIKLLRKIASDSQGEVYLLGAKAKQAGRK